MLDGKLTPDFPRMKLTLFQMQTRGSIALGGKDDVQITDATPVRIAELRRYAESIGEYPAFLFPDGVPQTDPDPDIPLHEAARIAYTETRGSRFAELSERLDLRPKGILRHYMVTIFQSWPIYARRLPSMQYELFPQLDKQMMKLLPDGENIGFNDGSDPIYADPHIKRSDLNGFIEWAKSTPDISPAGIETLGLPRQ